eukprot:IDg6129t1
MSDARCKSSSIFDSKWTGRSGRFRARMEYYIACVFETTFKTKGVESDDLNVIENVLQAEGLENLVKTLLESAENVIMHPILTETDMVGYSKRKSAMKLYNNIQSSNMSTNNFQPADV